MTPSSELELKLDRTNIFVNKIQFSTFKTVKSQIAMKMRTKQLAIKNTGGRRLPPPEKNKNISIDEDEKEDSTDEEGEETVAKKRKVDEKDVSSNDDVNFKGKISKVFQCDMCDTNFTTKDYVIEHLKNYHKYMKSNYEDFIFTTIL